MKKANELLRAGAVLTLFLAVTALMISGCKDNSTDYNSGSGGGSNPPDNEVWMQNTAFNPITKTITAGTTITWVNKDPGDHTATSGVPGSPSGLFDSGNKGAGGTFSFKFNTAGTFKYYCRIHGSMMTGTIVVQ